MCDSGKKCRGNKMGKELILLGVLLLYAPVESKNLLEKIKSRSRLSEAARIIEGDDLLKALITSRGYTAFIPTNNALQAYSGIKDAKLLQYHMVNLPYLVQDLPAELSTDLPGNPRLYVARLPSGARISKGYENFHTFINNAKIIDGNHEAFTKNDNNKQYLHIVDQVISPTLPRTAQGNSVPNEYLYPDAQTLLLQPHFYGLEDEYSVKEFERRVSSLNLSSVFSQEGKNTFFIPVDQALTQNTQDVIDKQVIHGHIIPGHVLFTRTVEKPTNKYESMAFSDNLKVLLSLENVTNSERDVMTYYVKSLTVAGDVAHKKGTVLARIPRGNIPVKNGVVHLIDRPLMIVASSISSYLQEQDGQLTKFHDLMKQYYSDMTHKLATSDTIYTLFAPSNEAFKMVNSARLNETKLNQEKLMKLLKMHIVRDRLTTDEIIAQTTTEEETMNQGRKLYFAVNNPTAKLPTVSVEGGGVNATITTPNIAAKNGVIHIIDRILGIPSQTVFEKLQSDPMLSKTFQLSEQNNWNERLKSRSNGSFTLFVPSNDAWDNIRRNMASAYKKLFMGSFAYHGRLILERHMIAGENLSIEDLHALTTSSNKPKIRHTALNVTRGKIYFQARVREAFGGPNGNIEYSLEWNGISARVIRPDLECVNGVVHVIDKVLMAKRDVTVSGSASPAATGLATLAATFVTVAFARALHR